MVQVHCSWRRLLEFHVFTINKSAHTKKVCKLIICYSYIYIYIYIYILRKVEKKFLFMKNVIKNHHSMDIFYTHFLSPVISSNIHRYFNIIFHEFKVQKKVITTEMFSIHFHNKFIKFWSILFFWIFFILSDLFPYLLPYLYMLLCMCVGVFVCVWIHTYIYVYIYIYIYI